MYSILLKKRDKKTLTRDDIQFVIDGFLKGEIKDY